MHAIRDVMVVRYRELYGTTLGDPHTVLRADLGRGVVMHFWDYPHPAVSRSAPTLPVHSEKRRPHQLRRSHRPLRMDRSRLQHFYTYRQGETA